ncbi:RT09-like protein [Mya arenaria]|uniref:RT09-like protein n=1 Tax=Mya arenaria TaxID=6604 RepID=A0ABY7EGF3_MYAAR|nr:RT09-like protein [Mya arenaria]
MSFTVCKSLRHLRTLNSVLCEGKSLQKVCSIHTSVLTQAESNGTTTGVKGELAGSEKASVPKAFTKQQIITRSIDRFIRYLETEDAKLEKSIAEYELGKRHLANIMGLDDSADLTREEVRKCLDYLLPSSLTNKEARPIMEHPLVLRPRRHMAEHDEEGRPTHYLHYTLKPSFYEVMHTMAVKYEKFKQFEHPLDGDKYPPLEQGTEWMPYEEFKKSFKSEKINENDYRRFIVLADRLYTSQYAPMEQDYLAKFRQRRVGTHDGQDRKILPVQGDDGRYFVIEKGKKKTAEAYVCVKSNGTGQWSINGQDISYFEDTMHRKAVIWPFQLCNVLEQYDVAVKVTGGGASGQANAIRLGAARALAPFLEQDMNDKLMIDIVKTIRVKW